MIYILFAILCILCAAMCVVLLATVDKVNEVIKINHILIKSVARHDDEIDGIVQDVNGMNEKMEKDYIIRMKDMNNLSKRIMTISKERGGN